MEPLTPETSDESAKEPAPRLIRRHVVVWMIVLLVFAAGAGALGYGTARHFWLAYVGTFGFGTLAVVAACAMSWGRMRDFSVGGRAAFLATVIAGSLALASLLSLLFAMPFRHAYLRSAQQWCEAQVPAVDAFRVNRGRYPESWEELEPGRALPWTVRAFDARLYANQRGYTFDLMTGIFSGWSYSPSHGRWIRYH